MSSDLLRTMSVVVIAAIVLFCSMENRLNEEFVVSDKNFIFTKTEINHSGHVYPYMATVVTMSCLLTVILLLICLGNQI